MQVIYEHNDNQRNGYQGIKLDRNECKGYLQNEVKDNILDRQEKQDFLERLSVLRDETGFEASPGLLADIEYLESDEIDVQQFRIGEAFAEVFLEQEYSCRFHWNENRDAKNPKGNKTGADIVGFIEIEDQILFLFGEVKTSSETEKRPPQVMTGTKGMEKQLKDLFQDRKKRLLLISYLANKMRHFPDGHPFRKDFEASKRAYFSRFKDYQLKGILVRDVDADEEDISLSYGRLKKNISDSNSIKFLAIYFPIPQEKWVDIMNGRDE